MAKEPKREFIRIWDLIWTDEQIRSLSDSAALAFIYLTGWSKSTRRDGVFTVLALTQCGATGDDVEELLNENLITKIDGGWRIDGYAEWQITEAEAAAQRAANRQAGAKGGEAKRDNRLAEVSRTEAAVDADVTTRLKALFAAWYDKRPTFKGTALREGFNTVLGHWAEMDIDIDDFEQRVLWRLDEYDISSEKNKRDWLGSLGNFLKSGKWSRQQAPVPSAAAVAQSESDRDNLSYEA